MGRQTFFISAIKMIGNKSLLLYKSKAQMLQYDRVGDKSFF